MTIDMTIYTPIDAWFFEKTGKNIALDLNFLSTRTIDSFDVIELILFLESHFKIKLDDNDMRNPGFPTLAGLVKIVSSKHH